MVGVKSRFAKLEELQRDLKCLLDHWNGMLRAEGILRCINVKWPISQLVRRIYLIFENYSNHILQKLIENGCPDLYVKLYASQLLS